jgi:hypothetical protein
MAEPLRAKAARFRRVQHQFARAQAHRERLRFERWLAEFGTRVPTTATPPLPPPAPPAKHAPDPEAQERFDRSLGDLLVRVTARPTSSEPTPSDPGPEEATWWSPEPALGFRAWTLVGDRLRGARNRWPRPAMTALCLNLRDQPADAAPHPSGECGRPPCGIYAMKHPDDVRSHIDGPLRRARHKAIGVGLVSMTGRVIEHDHGYRAQHATVIAFSVTRPVADGNAQVLFADDPA